MATDFDVMVIGSGFGGAVTACRLAEAGYGVLVLERGRRWEPQDYPRKIGDPWLWSENNPVARHGWADLRSFGNINVVQGAAVGGGSLIYSGISVDATRDLFEDGWPPEITLDSLQAHYDTVGQMLDVQTIPDNQLPKRTRLVMEASQKLGYENRFRKAEMATTFDGEWNYDLPDAIDRKHSKTFENRFGQKQGTCVHLGICNMGCDVQARNTLDLNYIPVAEKNGAEIRSLHIVRRITPLAATGYRIDFDSDHRPRAGLWPGQRADRHRRGRFARIHRLAAALSRST